MAKPVIDGPAYSTFARTARLALEEKGADYDLVEVDILSGKNKEPEHLARCPFGKVPAFEHDGFKLYETDAIVRYINDAFPGTDLEPGGAREHARIAQAMGIVNSYAYPSMITGIVIQRVVMPMLGGEPDKATIEAAVPMAETSVAALDSLIGNNTFVAGDKISLADLMLAPVIDYFSQTPEGQKAMQKAPNLKRWWDRIKSRPSVEKTRPKLG
jgi:glutathione S-transferase